MLKPDIPAGPNPKLVKAATILIGLIVIAGFIKWLFSTAIGNL